MGATWNQLEWHFDRLMQLDIPQRADQLRELQRQQPELASELSSLMANADRTVNFAIENAAQALLESTQLGEGSRLKGYRLIRQLGQGGMGVVYLARRETDYEQWVAVKLGRHILDPASSIRFQRERQILAQLNHPNIARLLDGGTTPSQTPYLVLEYIEGEQIDCFCREQGRDLIETLLLFQSVCRAVSHAHQHLIIHRDIKPSNILIQRDGTARLLDFGIAKIIDGNSASADTCTQFMTPAYVSPEQIQGKAIGTHTDVYALGLLLYELLTGERAQRVTADNLSELNRVVTEAEPTPLIRVLSRANAELTPAGHSLMRDHRNWQRDLQNILGRALSKTPSRRYS
ncbi:MAG: serine/threonine-protein kinase, partial [Pseudomonadota bacterium]